ncbi:hypothetical protein CXQ85_002117 [Candidozyma haemuli]|uniref:Zn(2)-C6 fungal-type domain-containing protein n=1 Tax=Candidozyma haemuli TaxID=45357 RepID=A0A2V1AQI3_9ASCO|nr:hypothetical protein CXQ85_002117 [[Candida] haemuloni]PVH20330.1 hypothetical protein CXQ85_002117 [[Candida] haemuloni]
MHQEDQFSSKWRVAKACARCHRLKSKCVYEDPTFKTCKRCFNLGLKCSVDEDPTAVNARKRKHTRTHQQVASRITKLLDGIDKELEFFEEKQPQENSEFHSSLSLLSAKLNQAGARLADSFSLNGKASIQVGLPNIHPNTNVTHELIYTHKVLSEQEARRRLSYFLNEMLPFFPIVALSRSLHDFDTLMKTDSTLLLTCIFITTVNDNALSDESPSKESNRRLHETLSHYVTTEISKHIFERSTAFTYHLAISCLLLSLWSIPSDRKGQFRSQVDLVNAHGVSLCADVGNVSTYQIKALADDNSLERNNLRTFLAVYSCCGSLSFSLPRFRIVSWCLRHDIAIKQLLTRYEQSIPTPEDVFVCCFTRLVRKGQEIFDYFISHGVTVSFLSTESGAKVRTRSDDTTFASVTNSLERFKVELTMILAESGLIDPQTLAPRPEAEIRKYCLIIVYHQLMMMNHDTLLSWQIFHMKPEADNSQIIPLIKHHVNRFKEACDAILSYYIKMNQISSKNYPTWLQYRCVHALISLVRLLILIKTKAKGFELDGFDEIKQKLDYYIHNVRSILDNNVKAYDSVVSGRVKLIVDRIVKWKKVVESSKSSMKLDYINITQTMKGQEMEKLKDPTSAPSNGRKRIKVEVQEDVEKGTENTPDSGTSFDPEEFLPQFPDLTMASNTEIFKDFDRDFLSWVSMNLLYS